MTRLPPVGTPGKCDGCGNLAPKRKRICRACGRTLTRKRRPLKVGRLDIPWAAIVRGRTR